MKTENIPDDEQMSEAQPPLANHPEHSANRGSLPIATWLASQFDRVSTTVLLRCLRLSWQSAPAISAWNALADIVLAGLRTDEFNATSWIAANLDLHHLPVPERDTPLLTGLSVKELKQVYHTLSTNAVAPDWQDFAWDTFTEMIKRELAMEM